MSVKSRFEIDSIYKDLIRIAPKEIDSLISLSLKKAKGIVLMAKGRQNSTGIHYNNIKKENIKTLFLKRPFTSVASQFVMLYLGDLYFNDLKLSSILTMAKLAYRIAPASFDLCLCFCPFQLL